MYELHSWAFCWQLSIEGTMDNVVMFDVLTVVLYKLMLVKGF